MNFNLDIPQQKVINMTLDEYIQETGLFRNPIPPPYKSSHDTEDRVEDITDEIVVKQEKDVEENFDLRSKISSNNPEQLNIRSQQWRLLSPNISENRSSGMPPLVSMDKVSIQLNNSKPFKHKWVNRGNHNNRIEETGLFRNPIPPPYKSSHDTEDRVEDITDEIVVKQEKDVEENFDLRSKISSNNPEQLNIRSQQWRLLSPNISENRSSGMPPLVSMDKVSIQLNNSKPFKHKWVNRGNHNNRIEETGLFRNPIPPPYKSSHDTEDRVEDITDEIVVKQEKDVEENFDLRSKISSNNPEQLNIRSQQWRLLSPNISENRSSGMPPLVSMDKVSIQLNNSKPFKHKWVNRGNHNNRNRTQLYQNPRNNGDTQENSQSKSGFQRIRCRPLKNFARENNTMGAQQDRQSIQTLSSPIMNMTTEDVYNASLNNSSAGNEPLQNNIISKYDLSVQREIHDIQNKTMAFKSPGGELICSDGPGLSCEFTPESTGISFSQRFC